ncbi:MAG: HAD family hydrolase [Clostridia bacterium]|nr:HAD family hydrolase [Clostridia bacterium]
MTRFLLWDLDGTLLPADSELLIREYLTLLANEVSFLVDPKVFITELQNATWKMITGGNGLETNETLFWKEFIPRINLKRSALEPLLNQFYQQKYNLLASLVKPSPMSLRCIEAAIEHGYVNVLATNPVFPLVALKQRLKWINLDESHFALITSLENMHYCKPKLEYYAEILRLLKAEPNQCLMIGNDVDEDLVAGNLGMATFLLEGYVLNRNCISPRSTYQGTWDDLYALITQRAFKEY